MRKSMLQMYHSLKESNSTSDFPKLLANTMYKILLDKFKGINSPWAQYVMKSDLADFKKADRVIVSEAPDLLEVEEKGPYKDSTLKDYSYDIQLKTYGRTFGVSRQTIINDDLNAIKKQPGRFGRATARPMVKKIIDLIEGDHDAYDGSTLFAAGHSNSGDTTLANTTAGAAAVAAGKVAIENSTDPDTSEKMGIKAKYLMVGTDLSIIAKQLVSGTTIYPTTSSGGAPVSGISDLEVIVEPFITSATAWYVLADPNDCPVIEVGFLDGKETPDLLIKRADTVNLAGGEDPYGYEFDDIWYKVRHDWALALAYYQGIYRGKE